MADGFEEYRQDSRDIRFDKLFPPNLIQQQVKAKLEQFNKEAQRNQASSLADQAHSVKGNNKTFPLQRKLDDSSESVILSAGETDLLCYTRWDSNLLGCASLDNQEKICFNGMSEKVLYPACTTQIDVAKLLCKTQVVSLQMQFVAHYELQYL